MNRDQLLELVFGQPVEALPTPRRWLALTVADEGNPYRAHVRSLLGLDYRPVVVRGDPRLGGVREVATTLRVAVLGLVCTDPDYRGLGYATTLVRSAHEEAASHRTVSFSALFAPADIASFFERLGYQHPDSAPDGFLVCSLRDGEDWPAGTVVEPSWR